MRFREAAQAIGLETKLLYTVVEISEVTGMSTYGVREAMRRGELRFKAVGRKRLSRPEWIEEWLEA